MKSKTEPAKKRGRPKKDGTKSYVKKHGVPSKDPRADEEVLPRPKHPGGRPTKYTDETVNQLSEYFSIDEQNLPELLPTIEGFAIKLDVHVDTIYEWAKKHPEFSDALKKAKQVQQFVWANNTLMGKYNSAFSKFYGMNIFGWSDKTESDVNLNGIESILNSIHNG